MRSWLPRDPCPFAFTRAFFAQEGNDGLKFPCRSARNFAYGFHNDLHPGPEALLDPVDDGSNIGLAELVGGHNLDADAIQGLLDDLSLADVGLVQEDAVEADHLTPIRSDHHILDAPDHLP